MQDEQLLFFERFEGVTSFSADHAKNYLSRTNSQCTSLKSDKVIFHWSEQTQAEQRSKWTFSEENSNIKQEALIQLDFSRRFKFA